MNKSLLILPFIIFIFGCEEQPEVTTLEYNNNWNERTLASQESEGKKLWRVNCAICHTASTGYPDRLYATKDDIESALENISSMANLTHITEADIELIYDYLNNEAIKTIQENKVESEVARSHVLGTRNYIVSKFLAIYGDEGKDIIEEILNYSGSFGGTCSNVYEECVGDETENAGSVMNMSSNAIRRGMIIKTCRNLHDDDDIVDNAISYIGIDTSADFSEAALKLVISEMVNETSSLDEDLIENLQSIYSKAIDKNKTRKEAWSYIIYTICSSLAFEKV